MKINVPISVGELIDKITILEIKSIKIKDPEKNKSVKNELTLLKKTLKNNNIKINLIKSSYESLIKINSKLWNIENKKRKAEKDKIFDDKFIKLARNVYLFNDERAKVKLRINQITNSEIIEIKSYE